MLTRHAITRRADQDGVDAAVVEKDYVLAHVVAQLHYAKPADGGRLVFKGGTSLRLVHIGEYRYSADLDFTVIDGTEEAAVASLTDVLDAARVHAEFPHLELTEVDPREVAYIGPLGAARPRTIKIDIADNEYVETVTEGTVLDGMWDDLPAPVAFDVYPIDEIAAEKLRCVIQRALCRDLYDIYRLVDMGVSLADIRLLFERKTKAKRLDPSVFADRFEDRAERYRSRWDNEMGQLMADPTRFDDVVRVVRRHLRTAGLLNN